MSVETMQRIHAAYAEIALQHPEDATARLMIAKLIADLAAWLDLAYIDEYLAHVKAWGKTL